MVGAGACFHLTLCVRCNLAILIAISVGCVGFDLDHVFGGCGVCPCVGLVEFAGQSCQTSTTTMVMM